MVNVFENPLIAFFSLLISPFLSYEPGYSSLDVFRSKHGRI